MGLVCAFIFVDIENKVKHFIPATSCSAQQEKRKRTPEKQKSSQNKSELRGELDKFDKCHRHVAKQVESSNE